MTEYEFHETANAFPYINGDAYETLKEDIRINGIIEPIYIFEGKIIDGRNRYRIAKDLGLDEVPTQSYDGDNPINFVQSMNLHRRQLTPSQKAAAAAFLSEFKQGQHSEEEEYETQETIAKKLGISRRMVVEATSLKRKADADLIERVKCGDISLHNATALARLSADDQRTVVGEGADRVKEVAKKIKAMTKGTGRKKKNDPERILDLEAVNTYTLPDLKKQKQDLEIIGSEYPDSDFLDQPIIAVKPTKKRGKKVAIEEANDFGHSLINAIIVLGATAEDANEGGAVIEAILSENQLVNFTSEYNETELRTLLSVGVRTLEKLIN